MKFILKAGIVIAMIFALVFASSIIQTHITSGLIITLLHVIIGTGGYLICKALINGIDSWDTPTERSTRYEPAPSSSRYNNESSYSNEGGTQMNRITPTTFIGADTAYDTMPYTTVYKGCSNDFLFKYEKVGSEWRAYILSSPSYGRRPDGYHETHRHKDMNKNLYFICWEPSDGVWPRLDQMIAVSKMWADATAKYIHDGTPFG